jgi:hypothetical protein
MVDLAQLRRTIAYNQWADEKLLDAAAGLSTEELERPRDAYFGSVVNTSGTCSSCNGSGWPDGRAPRSRRWTVRRSRPGARPTPRRTRPCGST